MINIIIIPASTPTSASSWVEMKDAIVDKFNAQQTVSASSAALVRGYGAVAMNGRYRHPYALWLTPLEWTQFHAALDGWMGESLLQVHMRCVCVCLAFQSEARHCSGMG